MDELQQGDDSDESDDIALADIAARANGNKANIIKLKRSKGKLGANDARGKKRRLDAGGAASSPGPVNDADLTLAELSAMIDGDESVLASRQASPTPDDASFALDLDAAGKVPIDARRAQQLEDAHRRIWTTIAKRDVPKVYRTVLQSSSSKTMYWRRLSSVVQREAKRGAARNNKTVKDVQLRARKVMREVLVFWRGTRRKSASCVRRPRGRLLRRPRRRKRCVKPSVRRVSSTS